jgi:hypothetical protein
MELSVQEYGRLRHDQVGLEVLACKWRLVQVENTNPLVGSVSGGALPALSCQV